MQRDTIRNHIGDWDEQRERLSAYLDGEMSEDERVALEQHLPACEQCQGALDDLREVRTLLKDMPLPALPRSFAIPTTGAVPTPLAAAATMERPERGESQPVARGGGGDRWSGVLQALGGFVAAAGVILMLGAALMRTGGPLSASRSSAESVAAGRPSQTGGQGSNTSTAYGSRQVTPTRAIQTQETPNPTPAPTPAPTSVPTPNVSAGTESPIYGPNEPAGLPVVPIGAGMAGGGAVLFIAGRVAGRRRRRA